MLIEIIILGVVLLGAFLFFLRMNQSQQQNGFKLLQESFEGMQRNLLLSQKEFERTYELRTGTLRTEIQDSLQNNRKELSQGLTQSSQAVEQRVVAMDQKLEQRLQTLTTSVGSKLEQNLKEGFLHFEKIQEHLKQAEKQLLNLNSVGQSINDLNNLLKLPHLRGSFGEAMLEKMLNDLLPQGAYELQYRIVPNSTERVDAVIKYPNCVLPIDSKFPREQVLPLFETGDPETLEVARKTLSDTLKTLARQIKEKYIHPEHGTADMALLFVPSETLYFEVLKNIRLCEDLAKHKVFAVSPNTLAVTLNSIAMGRAYYDMSRGVEKTIGEIKKAQQHFRNFEGRFDEVGQALGKAQNAYNTASTHLSRYDSAVNRLTGGENEVPQEIPMVTAELKEPPALPS
jgi:DNA recombination protein RmuC